MKGGFEIQNIYYLIHKHFVSLAAIASHSALTIETYFKFRFEKNTGCIRITTLLYKTGCKLDISNHL